MLWKIARKWRVRCLIKECEVELIGGYIEELPYHSLSTKVRIDALV